MGCSKNSPTHKDDVGLWGLEEHVLPSLSEDLEIWMQQLAGVREFIQWLVRRLPFLFPSEWLLLEEVLTN